MREAFDGTDKCSKEALIWLRYVLNPSIEVPAITDWKSLFLFAKKQALIGICLPLHNAENIEKTTLLQWIGCSQLIVQRNRLLNKRVEQLFGMLENDGYYCCLLKGQGNAALYPNPLLRCSGDIDVWINAEESDVFQYVRSKQPNAEVSYKHIHFSLFSDASVDVHTTPLKFYSSFLQARLQRWITQNKAEQFKNQIRLVGTERDVCVPTSGFNVVYQLGHMLVHLFDEGLGLRQLVDYYYVLKSLSLSEAERRELVEKVKYMGLLRFARSLMWIECDILGLPVENRLVIPNYRWGKRLLGDILEGGNFGHYSQRYKDKKGFFYSGFTEAWRDMKLLPIAPREGAARLASKIKTAIRHIVNVV